MRAIPFALVTFVLAAGCATQEAPSLAASEADAAASEGRSVERSLEWNESPLAYVCGPMEQCIFYANSPGSSREAGFSVMGNASEARPVRIEAWWNATTGATREIRWTIWSGGIVEERTGPSPFVETFELPPGNYSLHPRPADPFPTYVSQDFHVKVTGEIEEWDPFER